MHEHPLIMQTSTNNPRSQAKFFFFFQSKRQFVTSRQEGLNSSLAYSGGELLPYTKWVLFNPGFLLWVETF